LPDLCLARNWCYCAHLLVSEGVDDGGFAGIGITNKPDRDLFPVGVEGGELTEKLDERTLAEGVVY